MRRCNIDNIDVECSNITVDSHSFGKPLPIEYAKPYVLEVEFTDAVACFSDYYQSFVEREAEDEGFEEAPAGYYLRLRETGYRSFERMLVEQPDLLSMVLLRLLPAEFIGYLFADNKNGASRYVLQTLERVRIADNCIACAGASFVICP